MLTLVLRVRLALVHWLVLQGRRTPLCFWVIPEGCFYSLKSDNQSFWRLSWDLSTGQCLSATAAAETRSRQEERGESRRRLLSLALHNSTLFNVSLPKF